MKKTKLFRIITITAVLAVMLSAGGIAMTTAHLFSKSELVNTADNGTVENSIDEHFNGIEKSDVRVQNTGNVDAYVRVTFVPVWLDSEKNPTTLKTDGTYGITLNTDDWFKGSDGYYYCKKAIAPQKFTPVLIKSCTIASGLGVEYYGKSFDFQVLTQSIQSNPQKAVTEVWNVSVDEKGELTG